MEPAIELSSILINITIVIDSRRRNLQRIMLFIFESQKSERKIIPLCLLLRYHSHKSNLLF